MKKVTLLSLILVLALIAVTGTVSASGKRTFTAHLTAEAPGVETQAVGQAIFKVSKDGQSVDYKIIVAQLDDITMAHIHWKPGGGDAPPVVWLLPSGPPPTLIPGTNKRNIGSGNLYCCRFRREFGRSIGGRSVIDFPQRRILCQCPYA
jgi:hypothetical protein